MQAEFILLLVTLITIIGTPGPNNFVLFSLGLKEGYRGAVPTLLAINFGVVLVVMLSAIGAVFIAELLPNLERYFIWISFIVLCFIAFRMWPRGNVPSKESKAVMREQVAGLFLFQFVNPKIWIIAVGVIATFHAKLSLPLICITTLTVGLCLNSLWTLAGRYLGKFSTVSGDSVSRISSVLIFLTAIFSLYSNLT